MERRTLIKKLILVPVGIALFPSCLFDNNISSEENEEVRQEKVLGEMAKLIIPKTDTKGGLDLELHLFAIKMIKDCRDQEEQKAFWTGLLEFEILAEQKLHKPFLSLTKSEQGELLAEINAKAASSEILNFFFSFKNLIIKGYLNSEYIMTSHRIYELIPGRYDGYFSLNT